MLIARPWVSIAGALLGLAAFTWLLLQDGQPGASQGAWSAVALGASYPVTYASVPIAAAAAFEVWRLRRAQAFEGPARRRPAMSLLVSLWPLLAAALVGPFITLLWGSRERFGVPTFWDLVLLFGLCSLTILGFIALGAALGRWLPAIVAVPGAGFLALQLMETGYYLRSYHWRHVWGFDWFAWWSDQTWDPVAQVAPFLVWGAIAAAGLVLAAVPAYRPWRLLRVGASMLVVLVLAFGTAASVTAEYAEQEAPLRPRAASDLVCTGSAPQVCLWPGREQLRPVVTRISEHIVKSLDEYGVAVHMRASEEAVAPWPVYLTAAATEDVYRRTVLANYATVHGTPCDGFTRWPEFIGPMQTWLGLVAGLPEQDFINSYGADVMAKVQEVRAWPKGRQGRWYLANWDLRDKCDTPMVWDVA